MFPLRLEHSVVIANDRRERLRRSAARRRPVSDSSTEALQRLRRSPRPGARFGWLRRPGLDHVAFGCRDRDELVAWAARLDDLGVAHGAVVDAGYGSGLSFRDPDNIALELFAPPSPPPTPSSA